MYLALRLVSPCYACSHAACCLLPGLASFKGLYSHALRKSHSFCMTWQHLRHSPDALLIPMQVAADSCFGTVISACVSQSQLTDTTLCTVQDPAAFAAQHTAHFGSASALPLTQLLLVDSPEATRLLVTLAACPRPPLESADSKCAASAPVHTRTEQPVPSLITSDVTSGVESATHAALAPVHASMEQPAADGVATDARAVSSKSAGMAPGREAELPCQLTIERFDWRGTQPEVLELAAWDARRCGPALNTGQGGPAEAPAVQPCAATDRAYGAPGSTTSASCTDAGQPEPEMCLAHVDDPAPAALEASEQPECTPATRDGFQTSSRREDPALLRLATCAFTGSQLSLPRGRHLLRLRTSFGRACTVELRSCMPFCADDAVQVGPPALPQ